MTLNDYIREPKKDWNDKQWLQYAYVQVHSPWINDEDKEYFRDIIKRLQRGKNPPDNRGQKVTTNPGKV